MARLTIASNPLSNTVQRSLNKSSDQQSASFERLSSGLRINKASDDAAGLAVAETLKASKRIFTQGVRNINDGISLANTADGALNELNSMLARMKELAMQGANGTYTYSQRKAMNSEAQELRKEFNRIIQSTTFNGMKLVDGTQASLVIDTGTGSSGRVNIGIQSAAVAGDGTYGTGVSFANGTGATGPTGLAVTDVSGDGIVDIVTASYTDGKLNVSLGNGDGSFKAATTFVAQANASNLLMYDVNGDSKLDALVIGGSSMNVLLGNGDGSFKNGTAFVTANTSVEGTIGDFNGDGIADVAIVSQFTDALTILTGNGNGTFKSQATFFGGDNVWGVSSRDMNGDGYVDLITASQDDDSMNVFFGNGNGTFKSRVSYYAGDGAHGVRLADVNDDGVYDAVVASSNDDALNILLGNSDGTFKAYRSFGFVDTAFNPTIYDVNNDSFEDIVIGTYVGSGAVNILLGNGDGTFKAQYSYAAGGSTRQVAIADTNGDSVVDIVSASSGTDSVHVFIGNTQAALTAFTLFTTEESTSALTTIVAAENRLSTVRGTIGATLSRLAVGVENITSMAALYEEAYSRILDIDVAEETAKLVSASIRTQAATALLAQANQQPAIALQLLQ